MIQQLFYRLKKSAEFQNIFWMVSDRLWRMITSLIVGVWVIRYLGPDNYGIINYVLAFIGIATVITSFGMESFLIKELVNMPERKGELIYSGFVLRILASAVMFLALLAVLYYTNEPAKIFLLFFLLVPQLFTNAFSIVDLAFQAELQSRITIISRTASFILGAILKLLAIFTHQGIYVFAVLMMSDIVVADIFLFFYYKKKHSTFLFKNLRVSYVKEIFFKSIPFLISNVAIVFYMKIDQILLGKLTSTKEVGYFTASTKVTEVFYFIPLVITGSMFGLLINSRKESAGKYLNKSRIIFFSFLGLSLLISIAISLLSAPIISLLFGSTFLPSVEVLQVYIWTVVFVFAGVAFNQILVIENMQVVVLYKTLIGVCINVILNLLLIPGYGALGAAMATIVTQFVSSVGANFFFKNSRELFLSYLFNRKVSSVVINR
jgi:polysaccharide transporter, PST family